MIFDHNIYYGGDLWGWGVQRAMTFTTWRDTAGYDATGSSVADPLFISAGRDFHLQAGSPAINAGLSTGLLEDYTGAPIFENPDIGAYEFQPAVPQAPKRSEHGGP